MPRGVYPRRPRMAKPVVKKQVPAQPDPRLNGDVWEYMDTDSEVLTLAHKRKELDELLKDSERQAETAMRKVLAYRRSINVLENQVSNYEVSDEGEVETVRELTGEYAECAADGFRTVAQALQTTVIEESRNFVKYSDTATELKATADKLFQKWSAARTRARKEWEDHQAKLAKTAETK
jgi:hypothetical protein